MELNSQFIHHEDPNTVRVPVDESRADWVDLQMTRTFIANARTSMVAATISLLVTLVMLYGRVSTPWLLLWTVLVAALTAYRHWIIQTYRKRYYKADAQALKVFFKRHRWTWPASAVVWASLMFLYLEKVPLTNQFICILVLVGMGVFSAALMSARDDCFRPFVNALSATCFGALVASWFKDGVWSVQAFDVALVVLLGIFWGLLLSSGKRFSAVQRRGYELQYDNERLIASLREQTDTAMRAVTVKNGLLANAAHDLRQPVHALAFYADWLRNEPDLAELVVPKILLATDSVNALFNSLFDFAKIEAGAVQPKLAAVPVSQIVEDIKLQFSPSAFAKNIDFRQHLTRGYVWTDPLLIRRIVGNLMANAVRYTDHGGVLIATRVHHDHMWIEVWDTGVGIAPEHQGQVFQEFYKASNHAGTEDGFGLGLAIVRRLSEVLGHKVSMVSRAGRGTRMRVEVVLANADQTGPMTLGTESITASNTTTMPSHVLIADSEPALAK
jgi:signal transduction histidine kinase